MAQALIACSNTSLPGSIGTGCRRGTTQDARHLSVVFLLLIHLAEPAVIYYSPSNAFSTYGSICFLYGLFKGPCYPLGYVSAGFPVSRACQAVPAGQGMWRRRFCGMSAFAPKDTSWLTLFFSSLCWCACPSLTQAGVCSHRRKPSSLFLLLRGQLLQREVHPLA